MLIFSSCSKEQSQTPNYQVKEYFAENKQEVREKVYNFLLAADRLGIAAKDTMVFANQDPNEGAWLMEAAVNAEKVGHLDETTVDSKTITIEIQNELNEAGEIEMKASDVLSKYNTLLSEIEANEIDGKNTQLIDFKVESVDPTLTRIRTDILYGKVNPIEILPDSLPGGGGGNSEGSCTYLWTGSNLNTHVNNWSQTYNNVYVDNINNVIGIFASRPDYQVGDNDIGSYAWFFNQVAKDAIYYTQPVYSNSSTFLGHYGDQSYTPYTNANIIRNISDFTGCENLVGDGPIMSNSASEWDDLIDAYAEMIYLVENGLPNTQYRDYKPVCGVLTGGARSHASGLTVNLVGFIYDSY